ncbi:hypothetical protein COOONC_11028 [Cooperia oncophora]
MFLYRYDTGPIQVRHPNGSVTVNRQVIFYTGSQPPRLDFLQQIPGLIDISRVFSAPQEYPVLLTSPPSPPTTALPLDLRRRLKELMKKKVPPRRIDPTVTHTIPPSGGRRTDNRYTVEWSGGPLPTVVIPPRDTNREPVRSREQPHHQTDGRSQPDSRRREQPTYPKAPQVPERGPPPTYASHAATRSPGREDPREHTNWSGYRPSIPQEQPTPPSQSPRAQERRPPPGPPGLQERPTSSPHTSRLHERRPPPGPPGQGLQDIKNGPHPLHRLPVPNDGLLQMTVLLTIEMMIVVPLRSLFHLQSKLRRQQPPRPPRQPDHDLNSWRLSGQLRPQYHGRRWTSMK